MITDRGMGYGTSNIFADLDYPQAEQHLAKAALTHQISTLIKRRRLNQVEAARVLEIDQPKVSALLRGHLRGFSLDRLFRFLNLLDKDVDIVVKDKPSNQSRGRTHIVLRPRSIRRTSVSGTASKQR